MRAKIALLLSVSLLTGAIAATAQPLPCTSVAPEVRERVRERVVATRAGELARKDGEAKLAQIKAAIPAAGNPTNSRTPSPRTLSAPPIARAARGVRI